MIKAKWEPKIVDKIYVNKKLREGNLYGRIGCLNLRCCLFHTQTGLRKWYSTIGIFGASMSGPRGPIRDSLFKAKEDCIRLARELLINYREGLKAELKNFDLEIGE